MPDNLNDRGPKDRARINVRETWELDWWCREFGVTRVQIESCVKKVGENVVDVKKCLEK